MKKASHLFRRHGFAGASLEEVAQALGVTKPTLYYYVGNKAELVHACAMEGLTQATAAVKQHTTEGLSAALHAYAKVVGSDFGWCMVRVAEFALPVAMKNALQQQRKTLEQTLQAVLPQAEMVSVVLRAVEGVVLHASKAQWVSAVQILCAGLQPGAQAQTVVLAARPRQRIQPLAPAPVPDVETASVALEVGSAAADPMTVAEPEAEHIASSTPNVQPAPLPPVEHAAPSTPPATAHVASEEQALPAPASNTEPEYVSVPPEVTEKDVSTPVPTEVPQPVQMPPVIVAGTVGAAVQSPAVRKKAAAKIEQISLF